MDDAAAARAVPAWRRDAGRWVDAGPHVSDSRGRFWPGRAGGGDAVARSRQAREGHAEGPGAGPGRARVPCPCPSARLRLLVPAGSTVFLLAGFTGLSAHRHRASGEKEGCNCKFASVTLTGSVRF